MAAENPVPLLVGKVVDVIEGSGRDILLHWYSPKRKPATEDREQYGRDAWSPDQDPSDRRKPDQSRESLDAVCMTFRALCANGKLPKAVWPAVANQVLLSESREDGE